MEERELPTEGGPMDRPPPVDDEDQEDEDDGSA
jgi:hypothetical protein